MTELYIASTSSLNDDAHFMELLETVRPERRARVERIRRKEERRRSLCAELLLMTALQRRGISEYSVALGTHGKPYLAGNENLFFNLSHAGEYALCAISDVEVGCDIERIDPAINLAVADRFFTSEESAWIHAAITREEQVDRFFRLWTLKESLMKATGKGFSLSPRAFSFAMEQGDAPVLNAPQKEHAHYTFAELRAPDGYRASLCTVGESADAPLQLLKIET